MSSTKQEALSQGPAYIQSWESFASVVYLLTLIVLISLLWPLCRSLWIREREMERGERREERGERRWVNRWEHSSQCSSPLTIETSGLSPLCLTVHNQPVWWVWLDGCRDNKQDTPTNHVLRTYCLTSCAFLGSSFCCVGGQEVLKANPTLYL